MSTAVLMMIAGGTVVGAKVLGDQAEADKRAPKGGKARSTIRGMRFRASVAPGAAGVQAANVTGRSGSFRSNTSTGGATLPAEVAARLKAKALAEFDALSADAKRAACKALKAKFPTSPEVQALDCNSPAFSGMVTAAGVAIGTAIGGPVGGALGAVVATYAAPKLEEWAKDAWSEAEDLAGEAWDAVSSIW